MKQSNATKRVCWFPAQAFQFSVKINATYQKTAVAWDEHTKNMTILFISSIVFSLIQFALASSGNCYTQYKIVWKNQFIERETQECRIVYESVCSNVCSPHPSQQCKPHKTEHCSIHQVTECKDVPKKIQIPYTELVCKKKLKEVCDHHQNTIERSANHYAVSRSASHGSNCKNVTEDHCEYVTKYREVETTKKICHVVPKKHCKDVETELCTTVIKQKCGPYCNSIPKNSCKTVVKKFPIAVTTSVPFTVCTPPGTQCNQFDEMCKGFRNCFKNIDGRCCGTDPCTSAVICRGPGIWSGEPCSQPPSTTTSRPSSPNNGTNNNNGKGNNGQWPIGSGNNGNSNSGNDSNDDDNGNSTIVPLPQPPPPFKLRGIDNFEDFVIIYNRKYASLGKIILSKLYLRLPLINFR